MKKFLLCFFATSLLASDRPITVNPATNVVSPEIPFSYNILAHGNMGATQEFDLRSGKIQSGTLTANCTITLTHWPTTGSTTFQVRLTQDGTGNWLPSLPSAVTNRARLQVDRTAGATTIYTFESSDAGVTISGYSSYGGVGLPFVSKSADYTFNLHNANGVVLHPTTDDNARTDTVPAFSTAAYIPGDTLTVVNRKNTVHVTPAGGVIITLMGAGTQGEMDVAADSIATLLNIGTDDWIITGVGVTLH